MSSQSDARIEGPRDFSLNLWPLPRPLASGQVWVSLTEAHGTGGFSSIWGLALFLAPPIAYTLSVSEAGQSLVPDPDPNSVLSQTQIKQEEACGSGSQTLLCK